MDTASWSQSGEETNTDFNLSGIAADTLKDALKRRYSARITGELELPAVAGEYVDFPETVDAGVRQAFHKRGIGRLYAHQCRAWALVNGGKHTVIVTPTASGKSLCYNLPVLQAVVDARQKALYLFPTKALAQDQVAEISELNKVGNLGVRAYTFDGDTPGDARRAVRTHGDIVVSNPDMLHQGVLPHHTKWAQFFESLRFVVIDEMHTYRGVFGSHMANLMRRLRRICSFYGAQPVFILCSATIANPKDLAQRLVGAEVEAITESTAPRGAKSLLLWNPPVVNTELGIRASARSQSTRIARQAVSSGLKTIVFAQTRLMVEVLTKYLKDHFDNDPRKPARISAYRGGYLPQQRRETERRLRRNEVDCVVATSALELGVDIGSLDVCILNGFPGTIAGTWQRLGRAGRRNRSSLGVLVANSQALDQYMVRNPQFFIGASPEHARIAPDQLLILSDHIRCAAFELPFRDGETFGQEPLEPFLEYLEQQGLLHHEAPNWHWIADSYPANSVSLRSVAEGNFVVIDVGKGGQEIIAEVDYSSAAMTLYEGAIYLVQARPWQVEQLDWTGRKAFVRETRADYYTDAIDYTKLKILAEFRVDAAVTKRCTQGEVHVVRRVAGYKKIRYYSHENIGYGNVALPDQEMHTTAVWWRLSPAALEEAFPSRWRALDGFLSAAFAMHFVAVMLTMSAPRDLGRAVGNSDSTWFSHVDPRNRGRAQSFSGEDIDIQDDTRLFEPSVFLYDNYPGGIGLSESIYDMREQIVTEATRVIAECACTHGCPACIGPILASDEIGEQSLKRSSLKILQLLAQATPP